MEDAVVLLPGTAHTTQRRGPRRGDVAVSGESDVLIGPEPYAGGDALLIAWSTVFDRNAECLELVGQEGAREASIQSAAADAIQHGQLGGVFEGVVDRWHHRSGHQPGMRRALR